MRPRHTQTGSLVSSVQITVIRLQLCCAGQVVQARGSVFTCAPCTSPSGRGGITSPFTAMLYACSSRVFTYPRLTDSETFHVESWIFLCSQKSDLLCIAETLWGNSTYESSSVWKFLTYHRDDVFFKKLSILLIQSIENLQEKVQHLEKKTTNG